MFRIYNLRKLLLLLIVANCGPLSNAFAQSRQTEFTLSNSVGRSADNVLHAVEGETNFTFSPVSLFTTMGSLYCGAKGETADQIRDTFAFPTEQTRLAELFADLEDSASQTSAPILGVRCLNNEGYGVRVTEVLANSNAQAKGIKPKDLIFAVNGEIVRDEGDWAEQVGKAGGTVSLTRFDFESGKVTVDEVQADLQVGGQLQTSNAMWIQKGFDVLPSYKEIIQRSFSVNFHDVDFRNSPEISRRDINDWVRSETKGRVESLIPSDSISGLTRLIFTNTVTLDAAWELPFPTQDLDIQWSSGSKNKRVKAMMRRGEFGYLETPGLQMVELPYEGGRLSMLIVLPGPEQPWLNFRNNFPIESLLRLREQTATTTMRVTIPKFEFNSQLSLKSIFETRLQSAFSDVADFSGMVENERVKLEDVLQEAYISVQPAGTKAGAATAAIIGLKSAGGFEITVDRPFIFIILERSSGLPWFVGQVFDPHSRN